MNYYDNYYDDAVFPTSFTGLMQAGMITEASTDDIPKGTEMILESSSDISAYSTSRAGAMSALLAWADEADLSYIALDEYIYGVCDLDGDFELDENEEELYNETWAHIPAAILSLCDIETSLIDTFVNEEDEKIASLIGKQIRDSLDEYKADDDEIISAFAFGEHVVLESANENNFMILEATFKKKKVVRDGKVQVVRKRASGKARISAAQRAGLKKARRKAHSAAAKTARKKSLKIRKNRGL